MNLESFGTSSPLDAIRAHQRLQNARGEGYRKEVTLTHVVEDEHFILEVGGRIDGVFETADPVIIEEIKTTNGDLDKRASREAPTHWGQLHVYAYIYALDNDLDAVIGRLTYYHLETGRTREIDRPLERHALQTIFEELARRYLARAKRVEDWLERRDDAIRRAEFPFTSYRSGQREMAVQVYRAIHEKQQLLVRAPTGIGKTQAALFPAIKALGENVAEKIFYLTARTTGRAIAEKAINQLRGGGLRLKSVTLTAKEKICFNTDKACTGEECSFARGFYDRIEDAVLTLDRRDDFSRKTIETVAREHCVCPFELSLELSLYADLIICDYNYVFDPRAYLRRFFDNDGGAHIFLVDEAHNLVDRARDMYSAELSKRDVLALRRQTGKGTLHHSLSAINKWFLDARKEHAEDERSWAKAEPPETLVPLLKNFLRRAETLLRAGQAGPALVDLYFDVWRFARVLESYDARYVACYEATKRDLRLKLFCMDPSAHIAERLAHARSTIFFSATLTPMEYHRTTIGCGAGPGLGLGPKPKNDAQCYVLPSPFPKENLSILIAERIATTYRRRDATRESLARLLATFVSMKRGNYLLYFPSYQYMSAVQEALAAIAAEVELVVQHGAMEEHERSAFLDRFSESNERTLVGLAVMGGFFGEGIDLVGERLTGAAVIGVGLPGLSPERDHIKNHFERERGAGFDYAYMFPGMNRVLQAAGRVIRSETDRGAVLLVDERFAQARYRALLPPEWEPTFVGDEQALRTALTHFWRSSLVPV